MNYTYIPPQNQNLLTDSGGDRECISLIVWHQFEPYRSSERRVNECDAALGTTARPGHGLGQDYSLDLAPNAHDPLRGVHGDPPDIRCTPGSMRHKGVIELPVDKKMMP